MFPLICYLLKSPPKFSSLKNNNDHYLLQFLRVRTLRVAWLGSCGLGSLVRLLSGAGWTCSYLKAGLEHLPLRWQVWFSCGLSTGLLVACMHVSHLCLVSLCPVRISESFGAIFKVGPPLDHSLQALTRWWSSEGIAKVIQWIVRVWQETEFSRDSNEESTSRDVSWGESW